MRAVVYVPLALVAVAVLGMREPEVVDAPMPQIQGWTAQREPVRIDLAPYGAVAVVKMRLQLQCNWGRPYGMWWTARDGAYGEFSQTGSRFTVRERWDGDDWEGLRSGSFDLEGEVHGKRLVVGTVRAELWWTDGSSCGLGDLGFRADKLSPGPAA
jgi:hypothetical protein